MYEKALLAAPGLGKGNQFLNLPAAGRDQLA